MVSKADLVWRLARRISSMSKEERFDAFHLTDAEDVFGYYSYNEAKKLYEDHRQVVKEGK